MTPYDEALQLIQDHPGTGSATSLAKLVLSLYNGRECPFSFAECVGNLDGKNTDLALRMVTHYCEHGETQDLRWVGAKIVKEYPRLWELGWAAFLAKSALQEQWEREDNERA